MTAWLNAAGFHDVRWWAMTPEPKTKGPSLFVAVARRGLSEG
jgi:hypothetical protein